MRNTHQLATIVITAVTLGASDLVAQSGELLRDKLPHRVLVLAHADPASRELAIAVRRQLASDRRYEIVAPRALTRAERPADTSADSTLTHNRALARVLNAVAFIDVDASGNADGPRVMAMRSITDSDMVDVVTVPPRGSAADMARALVDRLLPSGWPGRTR